MLPMLMRAFGLLVSILANFVLVFIWQAFLFCMQSALLTDGRWPYDTLGEDARPHPGERTVERVQDRTGNRISARVLA